MEKWSWKNDFFNLNKTFFWVFFFIFINHLNFKLHNLISYNGFNVNWKINNVITFTCNGARKGAVIFSSDALMSSYHYLLDFLFFSSTEALLQVAHQVLKFTLVYNSLLKSIIIIICRNVLNLKLAIRQKYKKNWWLNFTFNFYTLVNMDSEKSFFDSKEHFFWYSVEEKLFLS